MRVLAQFSILIFSLLFSLTISAAPNLPKQLESQIQNLVTLFSDGFAVGYPDATEFQSFKLAENQELILTVFTVEGLGGGNYWTQYLAAFSKESLENNSAYYRLIDVIPVGGRSWRAVPKLKAQVFTKPKRKEISIVIDIVENVGDDAPNFPSKNGKLKLILKDGRFI